MPNYILKSLISLREEITERLMQNSEFRALQSLQRSIDEVSELARREDEEASIPQQRQATSSLHQITPASLVRETLQAEQRQAATDAPVVRRVTPAHFTAARRVI